MTNTDVLIRYMESRLKKEPTSSKTGPVITISREMGCPGKPIAAALMNLLNEENKKEAKWRYISNELLEESAQKLKVHPKYIKHIFTYNDRNTLHEIIAATRKEFRYKSDRTIKNTIGQVIRGIGENGHCIIVGRGGVAHTRHIPKALHIRLIAPFDWRVRKVVEHNSVNLEKAKEKVLQGDKNRQQFLQYYLGESCLSEYFDITLNCSRFTIDECARIIFDAFRN